MRSVTFRKTSRVVVVGLVAGLFGIVQGVVAQAPTRVLVRPCSAGDDCQLCNEPEVQGLRFLTPGEQSALVQRVNCSRAANAPRCGEGSRIEWQLQQLRSGQNYRVELRYNPNTDKYEAPEPPYAFEDVFGAVVESGAGPTFTAVSPTAANAERVWPYSVHVFRTTGGGDELVACADPEIIIDP